MLNFVISCPVAFEEMKKVVPKPSFDQEGAFISMLNCGVKIHHIAVTQGENP